MTTTPHPKARRVDAPDRCASHLRVGPTGYIERACWIEDRWRSGMKQRRCPTCLLWFFRDEFGPGWGKVKSEMSTELRRGKGGGGSLMDSDQPIRTYLVVENDLLPPFVSQCNRAMMDGWRPLGGIATTVDGANNWRRFFQAFTKEKP